MAMHSAKESALKKSLYDYGIMIAYIVFLKANRYKNYISER